jgi:hypothetical protein
MSHVFATAGTKIFIGSAAKAFEGTDFVASDFSSITWTEVGGTRNLGSSGDTSELIPVDLINEDRTRKLKGTRNAGSMQFVSALDLSDAGQLALIAAEKTKDAYPIKIQFKDAPAGGTPSLRYFVALVMSAQEQLDEANSVMTLNTTLEIDSNIVRVAAAPSGGG